MKRAMPLLLLIALLAISCSNGTYTFCTVSFQTYGGTEVPAQEVIRGRKAVEPRSPEKKGYTFLYWTLDGNKYDFSTPVEKSITLLAKYEDNRTIEEIVTEAKRIYKIADILVNGTTFGSGEKDASKAFSSTDDAALLLATALNIEKDDLYIEVDNKTVV